MNNRKNWDLSQSILEIYNEHEGLWVYRKIHLELTEDDQLNVNHKKVFC